MFGNLLYLNLIPRKHAKSVVLEEGEYEFAGLLDSETSERGVV